MIKILKYLKPKEVGLLFLGIVFILLQVFLDLKMPDYMSEITRIIQTTGSTIGEVLTSGGFMIACALGSLLSSILVGFFSARIAAGHSATLRDALYKKVDAFSMSEINSFSTSSLITRTTNDISQIQILVAMGMQMLIKAPITAVWAITKISTKEFSWSLATAGGVFVMLIIIILVFAVALPKTKIIQRLTDKLNSVTRENLTGVRVVRAYNAENYQQEKFHKADKELTHTHIFVSKIMAIMQPGMQLIMSGLTLAIYWIGAFLISRANMMDRLTIFSEMVVFTAYAVQIIISFMMISMILAMLPRASVSAVRINEVLKKKVSITDGEGAKIDDEKKGEVEFRNVSFKYPDSDGEEYVLDDISFVAEKGKTLAIIGSTGSGKSTLINLIPRFFDATEGSVLVGGEDVKNFKLRDLYDRLGYVSQKAVMFKGTVKSNVVYGSREGLAQTDDNVMTAIDISKAKDFVTKMKFGIDAPISRGGTNVSGGQKQRLSIARAVARKPEIFIFDDSFSALDYKTDKDLRARLKEETAGTTSIIVAQRIGTIMDADKIIVLAEGKKVGEGTHGELLKSCTVYREIAESQFSKEELENG